MFLGFYEAISQYYDQIFPAGAAPVRMLTASAGPPPKRVLDVACGSGEYSLALAGAGYQVTAVDLDPAMVAKVRRKAEQAGCTVTAFQADMLRLTEDLADSYDLIFCIGNSLVHLDGLEAIGQFLVAVRQLLRPAGRAVFQIINYDRILAQGITSLPTIVNEPTGLRFERNYRFDPASGRILFHTVLSVAGQTLEHTIPLFPLQSPDFAVLLGQAGFKTVEWFGDFQGGQFDPAASNLQVVRVSGLS